MNFKINATPGPWQLRRDGSVVPGIENFEGVIVARPTCANIFPTPKNVPDERTACDNATLIACTPELLEAVKLAYRKHHLGDDSIGWDELSDKLGDALNNAMGPRGFVDWMDGFKREEEAL
jgi:hypothetical protein